MIDAEDVFFDNADYTTGKSNRTYQHPLAASF